MSGSATAIIVEFSGISIVPSAAVTITALSLGCGSLVALVGVTKLLREGLQQLPADRAVLLHERSKIPERESVTGEFALGGHRGHARALVDQGDLAEVVALPERAALLAAHVHLR